MTPEYESKIRAFVASTWNDTVIQAMQNTIVVADIARINMDEGTGRGEMFLHMPVSDSYANAPFILRIMAPSSIDDRIHYMDVTEVTPDQDMSKAKPYEVIKFSFRNMTTWLACPE